MNTAYSQFIAAKAYSHIEAGFSVGKSDMPWRAGQGGCWLEETDITKGKAEAGRQMAQAHGSVGD